MDDPHVQYAKEVVAGHPMAAFLGIRLEESDVPMPVCP